MEELCENGISLGVDSQIRFKQNALGVHHRVLAACEYYTRSSLIYFTSQTKDRTHEATNLFQPIYQYLMIMGVFLQQTNFL